MATLEIDDQIIVQTKVRGLFTENFNQGLRLGIEPKGITPVTSALDYAPFNQEFVNVVAEISTLESTKGIKTPDIELRIQAVPQKLEFDKDTLEVKCGQLVSIVFENPDFMQHNLLIVTPGNLEVVGSAADAMVNEADAAERNYVPNIPEVLFSTRILNPNEQTRLTFKAPKVPGSYPFVCTFPGHWRTMNGILIVK